MFNFRPILALSASLILSGIAHADAITDKTLDRAQFIEVTRIVQLPADEQAKAVPQLYELLDKIPRTRGIRGAILYFRMPWHTADHEKLTPEEQADLVEQRNKTQYFFLESRILASQTLQKYPAQTTDLLRADLRSDDATRQLRGLSNLDELGSSFWRIKDTGLPDKATNSIPYASFYPEIAQIFQSAPPAEPANRFGITGLNLGSPEQPPLKTKAESALMRTGLADAVALLIDDDAAQPLLHYQAIAFLGRNNSNDARLQTLAPYLRSEDATLRFRALTALPIEIPAVRDALPILIDDLDANVRALAVSVAFGLKGAEFDAVRTRLQSKLADASPRVRWMAADGFARLKNPSTAPVLLELLRNQAPDVNS